MTSGKASVAIPVVTPGRTTTVSSGRMRKKRWIPTRHYCNRRGHIRPRCFQYFADLRRANQERFQPRKLMKQEWMKKYESKCNVTRTSLKAVEEINIKEKNFCGKYVADMRGESDLCDDASGDQVDVSIAHIDAREVEESSNKLACWGRIPSFLIFLCLFLVKRGSKC